MHRTFEPICVPIRPSQRDSFYAAAALPSGYWTWFSLLVGIVFLGRERQVNVHVIINVVTLSNEPDKPSREVYKKKECRPSRDFSETTGARTAGCLLQLVL